MRTSREPRPRRATVAALAVLVLGGVACATTGPAPSPGPIRSEALEPVRLPGAHEQRFYVQEENDVFGITRKSDNFYTQGLRLGARWRPRSGPWIVQQEGADELWGFELGQNIYTPSDIELTDLAVLRRDRPYAGYLYVGPTLDLRWRWSPVPRWARLRLGPGETDAAFASELHLEVRVGRTGPKALGGAVQTGFHMLIREANGNDRQALPLGWGIYETADASSLDATLDYATDWVRLSWPIRWADLTRKTGSRFTVRVQPGARADVGGIVDALGLGLEARVGLAGADVDPTVATSRPRMPFELYLWGRLAGRYVAWSRLIEGKLLGGSATDIRREPWVADVSAGFTLRFFVLELAVAQQWRTAEIRPVPAGTNSVDNFGSFQLSFLFYD